MKKHSLGLSNVYALNFTMHSPRNISLYIMHIFNIVVLIESTYHESGAPFHVHGGKHSG